MTFELSPLFQQILEKSGHKEEFLASLEKRKERTCPFSQKSSGKETLSNKVCPYTGDFSYPLKSESSVCPVSGKSCTSEKTCPVSGQSSTSEKTCPVSGQSTSEKACPFSGQSTSEKTCPVSGQSCTSGKTCPVSCQSSTSEKTCPVSGQSGSVCPHSSESSTSGKTCPFASKENTKCPYASQYIGSFIDHTLLSPTATTEQIEKLCQEALDYRLKAVCVNPVHLKTVKEYLSKNKPTETCPVKPTTEKTECNCPFAKEKFVDHKVKVATVVGFPLGQNTTETKIHETKEAVALGVDEIDVVMNVGKLVEGDYAYVINELKAIVDHAPNTIVKVIIESGLLRRHFSAQKIEEACICCVIAGVHYVKTSTGFLGTGATSDDVTLMHKTVASFGLYVKASGGVATASDALKMLHHGASRIGTSKGVAIVVGSCPKSE